MKMNGKPSIPSAKKMNFATMRICASPDGFFVQDSAKNNIYVAAMDVAIRPNMPPMIQVAMACGNIDIVGKPLFAVMDPSNGQARVVRKIVWADGTEMEFPAPERAPEQAPQPAGGQAEPAAPPTDVPAT
jgi:hypothetical protein